jgi:hypothetical protein
LCAKASQWRRQKGAVVFDLRGARNLSALPSSLPLPKPINGPSLMRRQHSGYAPPDGAMSSGGYKSTWDMDDLTTIKAFFR